MATYSAEKLYIFQVPPDGKALGLPRMSWPPAEFLTSVASGPLPKISRLSYGNEESKSSSKTSYLIEVKRGDESWTLDVNAIVASRVYSMLIERLAGTKHSGTLPPWPATKKSSENAEMTNNCLIEMVDLIKRNPEVASLAPVQAFLSKGNEENKNGMTEVLYLAIESMENVGNASPTAILELELVSDFAVETKLSELLSSYVPSSEHFLEYNVLISSKRSQFLQLRVNQATSKKSDSTSYLFDLPLSSLEPYQNYRLRLPMVGNTSGGTGFMGVRACFVPMGAEAIAKKKEALLSRLPKFRIQPHKLHYGAGETVRGTIHLTCAKPTAIDSIGILLNGVQTIRIHEGEQLHRVVLDDVRVIARGGTLEAGFHCFPFEMKIPHLVPHAALYGLLAVQNTPQGRVFDSILIHVNGPSTPINPPSGKNKVILPQKGGRQADVTFPAFAESFRPFHISVLLNSAFADGEKISMDVKFKETASFPNTEVLAWNVKGNVMGPLGSVTSVDLSTLVPQKTEKGLLYQFGVSPNVSASIPPGFSPLISTGYELTFKLNSKVGSTEDKSKIPVYSSREFPDPWTFYPPLFGDFKDLKPASFGNSSILTLSAIQDPVRFYRQVSAIPPPSGWTIRAPDPTNTTPILFPSLFLFPSSGVWNQHFAPPVPVSVFHFGSLSPHYPAMAPLPSFEPAIEGHESHAEQSSSSSKRAKKRKDKKEKRKQEEDDE